MALSEIYKLEDVARHLGVSVEFLDREARRTGCCSIVGHKVLFTELHVDELLEAWRPAPEQPRLAPSEVSSEWRERRPFTPDSLAREWGVSAQHIRNLIKSGELRHFKLGRLFRISIDAAKEYQERNAFPIAGDQAPLA